MKTKICSHCKKRFPLERYNRNQSTKDGLQRRCRKCDNKICKQTYWRDAQRYRNKTKQRGEEIRAWFVWLKQQKQCQECGDKRWYVLEFHHSDDNKEACVSTLVARGHSKKKILAEIGKCVVLCANCHREKHYLEWSHETAMCRLR